MVVLVLCREGEAGRKAHLVLVDVRCDSLLVKKWCASLANDARLLPDVLDTPPGDGSWC